MRIHVRRNMIETIRISRLMRIENNMSTLSVINHDNVRRELRSVYFPPFVTSDAKIDHR